MRSSVLLLALTLTASVPLCAQAPGGSASPAATAAAAPPAWHSDPQFLKALASAKQLVRDRQLPFAFDAYKKANKIAGGQCVECLEGLYSTSMKMGDYKSAINAAGDRAAVETDPRGKAVAWLYKGQAILAGGGDKPKAAVLQNADAAFKEAIAAYPNNGPALFWDGKVLAQLGRMDDARKNFTDCLSCVSKRDPAYLRAQHFAENPELATHKMAPAFVVKALDGQEFNLDAMGGRVVLIDFWATWCGPCNEELPHMKEIAKEFAGQPLVIISVSWDKDEQKWKDFIAKNEMTWVQYRDADHKLTDQFGIEAIPHYFTIDSDGVLTSEMMGSGSNVEGKLKKLVAKARETQRLRAEPPVTGD
jgi:thiol-disulfide isomerase/thioredoxin